MCLRLFVMLLMYVSTIATEPTFGTLQGHVSVPHGGSAIETQVRVVQWYFVDGAPRITCDRVTYTDDSGNFSLQVPPGVYDVFVSRVDSEPIAKKLKIIPEKATFFNPALKGSGLTQFVE